MQSIQSINNSSTSIQSPLRSIARALLASAAVILTLLLSTANRSFAGSATWKESPTNDDWFTAANWTPRTVPNGPLDTATFASSRQTDVFIAFDVELNSIVFKPGTSAFTIESNPVVTPELTISGVVSRTIQGSCKTLWLTVVLHRYSSLRVQPQEV
jgi:hypothetical protein